MGPQRVQDAKKVSGHVRNVQAQKVLDLREHDQHRNAVGKANDHGHGNKADQGSQPEQPHQEKQHARHGGGNDQVGHAVAGHDVVHDDDECACGSANLDFAATQQGDQETRHDGRKDARLGLEAGGNGKSHGQGEGNDPDREPGPYVLPQALSVVALQAVHQSWTEQLCGLAPLHVLSPGWGDVCPSH